tara:strand:+ start:2170 stop:2541 length:372 start_codon:yes stop_codon:yes gene_type:complete
MAKEITLRTVLRVNKAGIARNFDQGSIRFNQTGTGYIDTFQIIGTGTHELISLGALTVPGAFGFYNMSTSVPCLLGLDVGSVFYPFASIPAKTFLCGANLGTSEVYAKAVGASLHLQFNIIEK